MDVSNSRIIVAKDVYGYAILTSIAVILGIIGVLIILREAKKERDNRNTAKVILGICVASGGSLVMLITILNLVTRK